MTDQIAANANTALTERQVAVRASHVSMDFGGGTLAVNDVSFELDVMSVS